MVDNVDPHWLEEFMKFFEHLFAGRPGRGPLPPTGGIEPAGPPPHPNGWQDDNFDKAYDDQVPDELDPLEDTGSISEPPSEPSGESSPPPQEPSSPNGPTEPPPNNSDKGGGDTCPNCGE